MQNTRKYRIVQCLKRPKQNLNTNFQTEGLHSRKSNSVYVTLGSVSSFTFRVLLNALPYTDNLSLRYVHEIT